MAMSTILFGYLKLFVANIHHFSVSSAILVAATRNMR